MSSAEEDSESNEKVVINNFFETISKNLQQQRLDVTLCDVVLQVDGKRFPAHRTILASSSDYFYKMFTIDMKEKSSKSIQIQNIKSESFKEILDSMYVGNINLSEDNLSDILSAASLMQVTMVIDAAKTFMNDALSITNSCFFLNLCNVYDLHSLKITIVNFVRINFMSVSSESDFNGIAFDDLTSLLKSDLLIANEEQDLFEIIVEWVNHDLDHRLEYFLPLFKQLRLQYIRIKYVTDKIQYHTLVRKFDECRDLVCDAFTYYFSPSSFASQKPRKCLIPIPDSVLFLNYFNMEHDFLFISSKKFSNNIQFNGLTATTILEDCAVATDYPYVYLCGGLTRDNRTSKQAVRFDGFRWIHMPAMNESRCGAAAVVHEGNLFVFGGESKPVLRDATCSSSQKNSDALNFVNSFETLKQNSNDYGVMPECRSYFAAASLNNRIYLIGGYVQKDDDPNQIHLCKAATSSTLVFSPTSGTWHPSNSMNVPRAEFCSAVIRQNIYVVGGYNSAQKKFIDSIEYFDTRQKLWTTINSFSHFFWGYRVPNDKIVKIYSAACVNDFLWVLDCSKTLFYYEPDSKKWTKTEIFVEYWPAKKSLIIPYAKKFHINMIF